MGNQNCLMVSNSIAKMSKNRRFSILVVNNTNQTVSLSKGCVIAKVDPIASSRIESVNNLVKNTKPGDCKAWDADVDVPSHYKPQIQKFLKKNKNLFASVDSELGHTSTVTMKIDTGSNPPIKLRPYRTPIQSRQVIEKTIDEMMGANIVHRSKSLWSFPVVIVDKKDGSKRFCVDFRKLNQITKPKSYPLPLIDDILALLGKAKYFTSLDYCPIKSGYWQVLMDEAD